MIRPAVVAVFAAIATLLFPIGEHVGHATVVGEVSRAVRNVEPGGLRDIQPMVSAAAADSGSSLRTLL